MTILFVLGWACLVSVAAVAYFILRRYISWYFSPLHKLPGPKKNNDFWFGVFFDLAHTSFMEPEKKWFEEAGYSDTRVLHTTQLLGKPTITIMDKKLAARVLAAYPVGKHGEPPRFPKHKPIFKLVLGDGLLAIEDEGWKTHRKIMEPLFNRNFLKAALGASVPSRVKQMIECWKVAADKHCEIDVASHASALSLDIIGDVGFDTNMHGVESIEAWADSISKGADIPKIQDELITALVKVLEVDLKKRIFFCLQPPESIATMILAVIPKLAKGRKMLNETTDEIIAKAMSKKVDESKPTSLLHLMLKTMDAPTKDKRFSMYDIHSELKTMLMAGHETAATWINWSLYVFTKYPDVQEKVYQDIIKHTDPDKDEIDFDDIEKMDYMNAFLQEVLRLYPPLGQILRVSRRPEIMEGVEIPPNTHVQIPNFLIQRHPHYWPEPESFKPERWINPTDEEKDMRRSAFMPFGGGPRLCIGQQFATMEVRMELAYLARAFRFLGAPSQRETEFTFESLISMRSKPDFKVVVKRRSMD